MKNKILIIAVLFSFLLISCKKEADEKKEEPQKQASVNEYFSIDLDVISDKQDDFALYYTEDKSINFTSDKAVWSGVKSLPTSQKVTLKLSDEIIPTNIRLDFGISKDHGDVVLEKLKMNYYDKSFEVRGSDFLKYFFPNDSIKTEIDEVKGTIKFLKNGANVPFYYPQPSIVTELAKMTK